MGSAVAVDVATVPPPSHLRRSTVALIPTVLQQLEISTMKMIRPVPAWMTTRVSRTAVAAAERARARLNLLCRVLQDMFGADY